MRRYLDDEGINIARGLVNKTTAVHKFGSTPSMSINTQGSVWDINDSYYNWTALDTANNLSIVCSNAGDVGGGHSLVIEGLDANKDLQTETVSLSAQTGISTTNTFKRVNRAYFIDGSAQTNLGKITIFNGANAPVARINVNEGQTLMAVYSVPNEHTAYIKKGKMSIQSGGDATGRMMVRYDGQNNFRISHIFEVAGDGGAYEYEFATPFAIAANSDIDVRARVRSNNSRVTAAFDLILIDNRNP